MRKLIIALLIIVSLLLVGCEKSITGETTLQTEKVCECPSIDLSEYDKRIEDLEQQIKDLREENTRTIQRFGGEVYAKISNETESNSWELQQVRIELKEEIERLGTRMSKNIEIQNCKDDGGSWLGDYCKTW